MPTPDHFNPFDPELAGDPATYWSRVARGPRLLPAGRQAMAVTRYDDVRALLQNGTAKFPERALAALPPGPFRTHNTATMAFLDPPAHGPVRHAVARTFAPATLAALVPHIEAASRALLDGLDNEADLVADYAERLPLVIIARILGVETDDAPRLRRAAAAVVAGLEPGARAATFAAADEAINDLVGLLMPKLVEPESGSFFHTLAGSGLPFDTLLHNAIFLLNAGHETTTRLIAGVGKALIDAPDLPPGPELVDEVLRLDPPLPFIPRFLSEPWEDMAAGTPVFLLIAAANRDPSVFSDPDAFDPSRPGVSRHLSFAGGRHLCLGASLARMEAEIAARHLATIAARLVMAPGAARTNGRMFQGWARLPIARA